MNYLYYSSQWLYLIVSAVLGPVGCVIVWLLVLRAGQKRLTSYTRWLTPMAIGTTITLLSISVLIVTAITRHRDFSLLAASYLLVIVAGVFHLVALLRLWKFVKALPPARADGPPEDSRAQADVWPPAPKR